MPRICAFPQTLERQASAAGAEVDRLSDGRYRIKAKSNGGEVGRFNTEAEVRDALSKLLNRNVPELDGSLPFPARGNVASTHRLKNGDQVSTSWKFGRKLAAAFATGPLKGLTPIGTVASFVESASRGMAKTGVYDVLESSMRQVHRFFAHETRANLGGRTYDDAIINLNKMSAGLTRDQAELSVLANESLTRQELRQPGVFLENGIDADHVEMASIFEKLGLSEDIPRLMRTNALVDDFLTRRAVAVNEIIPNMRRLIQQGQLPESYSVVADRLSALAGSGDLTLYDVMQAMNIPQNEADGMILLRVLMKMRVDDARLGQRIAGVRINEQPDYVYNIPAIMRYATAPELEAGFKDGFEQFAKKRGMSAQAVAVSKEWKKIVYDAFPDEATARRVLAGALPVFRQFIDVGMYPGRQYGASAKGAINTYTRVLVEDLPEGAEFLSRRVLSGHINPYELHPSVSANKHVRNMLMREHLDPKLEGVKKEILKIDAIDPEMGRIFGDHFNEVIGLPNEGFRRLSQSLQTMGSMVGYRVDDQMAERWISTMTKITSQAAIPFRVGNILRNSIQTLFGISYVGPAAWFDAMKIALGKESAQGYSMAGMKQAISMAIKAGAIDANVIPIHGNIVNFNQTAFSKVPLQQLQQAKDQLFDMGFSWYRSTDDFGRVVAFHAARNRINKFKGLYNDRKISYEDFKTKAKIKTFHEAVEAEFDNLVNQDRLEDAIDYIGKQFADKIHFVYGNGNHPVGWNGPIGRLFGQFGTFPTQYAQALIEGATRGTLKDRAEFIASHSAMNMGIVAAGNELFDSDLTSWAMFPSLQYTGGPYADVFIHLATMMSGNDAEQSLARRSLGFMLPSLEDPASIFVPGSYFVGDIVRAFDQNDPLATTLRAIGIRTLGPGDDPPRSALMDALAWVDEFVNR